MSKQANIQDKIKVLKSIIAGTMTFEHLMPPKHYFAQFTNDVYYIDDKEMNEETFNQWKATLRECDSLVIFSEQKGNYPLQDDSLPTCNVLPAIAQRSSTVNTEPVQSRARKAKGRKRAKNDLKNESLTKDENVLVVVPKRSGLMSEYGTNWEIEKNEYYLS